MKKRVFSGIRATGRLHLGNYFGAVKGMLELQNDPAYETTYGVVDLHTLTTPYDKEHLKEAVRNIIIDYLAVGLDPKKSTLIVQSMVPEHMELAYYFSTIMTVAKMQHLPTFKDKVKQHPDHVTMALLNYPVLMAADILIYKAQVVPAGLDQEPHIEVAREVARRMNQEYGTDFPEPVRIATKGEYVPSLTGEGKMSKSVEGSYINLTDDLETIRKKIAKIPTDSGKGVKKHGTYISSESRTPYVGNRAPSNINTLMDFVRLFQGEKEIKRLDLLYSGSGIKYGEVKESLSRAIYAELQPIQEKRKELEANPSYVDQVIAQGATKARKVAEATVREVREKMGLL